MNVLTGIAIFFVVWWIVLFVVLPFGINWVSTSLSYPLHLVSEAAMTAD